MKRKIITLEVETDATNKKIKQYFQTGKRYIVSIDEKADFALQHMQIIQCQVRKGEK